MKAFLTIIPKTSARREIVRSDTTRLLHNSKRRFHLGNFQNMHMKDIKTSNILQPITFKHRLQTRSSSSFKSMGGNGPLDDDDDDAFEEGRPLDEEDEQIVLELERDQLHRSAVPLPHEIVSELDKFIIGQGEAKKAVAVALRNRWRRYQLPKDLRDEVAPKNILMVGPTGVGKTEIARRVAKLSSAPFIKVEATKYTEVGYHGKDVDTMINELVEIAVHQTRARLTERIKDKIKPRIEEDILKSLANQGEKDIEASKEDIRKLLALGALEEATIDNPPRRFSPGGKQGNFYLVTFSGQELASGLPLDMLPGMPGQRAGSSAAIPSSASFSRGSSKSKMTVAEYRKILENQHLEKYLTKDTINKKSIESVENDGIVFIDEIDKICVTSSTPRPSASDEGVQRDLLPIIEGTVVNTKYGNVDTSKILFIASGAFHACKPSDMLPELQGRLPIRVELKGLSQKDLHKILTETENNMVRQQVELLKTEGVILRFTDEAVDEISRLATELNETIENIGARRLHTVVEKIVEECSFNCHLYANKEFVVDRDYVQKTLAPLMKKMDLSRYLL